MKPTVLLFGIDIKKEKGIVALAIPLGVCISVVTEELYSLSLESILANEKKTGECEQKISEDMAVFCDFTEPLFDMLLSGLRRKKIPITLKAVLTEHNKQWTPVQLYTELCRERDAFLQNKNT